MCLPNKMPQVPRVPKYIWSVRLPKYPSARMPFECLSNTLSALWVPLKCPWNVFGVPLECPSSVQVPMFSSAQMPECPSAQVLECLSVQKPLVSKCIKCSRVQVPRCLGCLSAWVPKCPSSVRVPQTLERLECPSVLRVPLRCPWRSFRVPLECPSSVLRVPFEWPSSNLWARKCPWRLFEYKSSATSLEMDSLIVL